MNRLLTLPVTEGSTVVIGSRKGYVLAVEDGYLWVVYTHKMIEGKLKPYDNTKVYPVKEV